MDRESVSLSCVTRPAYFRRTTGRTIVGIAGMDGIFLGIEWATSKREMGHEDKRGNEGEREGRRVRESGYNMLCIKGSYMFHSYLMWYFDFIRLSSYIKVKLFRGGTGSEGEIGRHVY